MACQNCCMAAAWHNPEAKHILNVYLLAAINYNVLI